MKTFKEILWISIFWLLFFICVGVVISLSSCSNKIYFRLVRIDQKENVFSPEFDYLYKCTILQDTIIKKDCPLMLNSRIDTIIVKKSFLEFYSNQSEFKRKDTILIRVKKFDIKIMKKL